MRSVFSKFFILACASLLLSAAPIETTTSSTKANDIFLLARVYFPNIPHEETKVNIVNFLQGLNVDTEQWTVWPMLACIMMPKAVFQSKSELLIPGKKFSTEVTFPVKDKDNQTITYIGALLLEVIHVYHSLTGFEAEFPEIHPNEGMPTMSLLLNFSPEASLQNVISNKKQMLMFVTFGPEFTAEWPTAMKEDNIKFFRQILLERTE